MSAKLDKFGSELEKTGKKKAEWDARVKDLERRYRRRKTLKSMKWFMLRTLPLTSWQNCFKCLRKM